MALSHFLAKLKLIFASGIHTHTLSLFLLFLAAAGDPIWSNVQVAARPCPLGESVRSWRLPLGNGQSPRELPATASNLPANSRFHYRLATTPAASHSRQQRSGSGNGCLATRASLRFQAFGCAQRRAKARPSGTAHLEALQVVADEMTLRDHFFHLSIRLCFNDRPGLECDKGQTRTQTKAERDGHGGRTQLLLRQAPIPKISRFF